MVTNDAPATDTSDRQIVIERLLNAPRERVFEAWTDPAQVACLKLQPSRSSLTMKSLH